MCELECERVRVIAIYRRFFASFLHIIFVLFDLVFAEFWIKAALAHTFDHRSANTIGKRWILAFFDFFFSSRYRDIDAGVRLQSHDAEREFPRL